MKNYIIIFILFVCNTIYTQNNLANFYSRILMDDDLNTEEKRIIDSSMFEYFRKKKIKIKKNTNIENLVPRLDQKSLVDYILKDLTGKIEAEKLDEFLSKIIWNSIKYQILYHFAIEKNGLSSAENEIRNNLTWSFGLNKLSSNGQSVFFQNYLEFDSKIYKRYSELNENRVRVDSVRVLSKEFFKEKLDKRDAEIIDSFWIPLIKDEYDNLKMRDSIHRKGLVILKSKVDSLIAEYDMDLKKERLIILEKIDSNSIKCIKDSKSVYLAMLEKRKLASFSGAKKMYLDLAPNMWYGIEYNYLIMSKYPSTQYAQSQLMYRSKCDKIVENYEHQAFKYLEFEEKLNKIVVEYSVSLGTIFYNRAEYNNKYVKTGIFNMLLYYID